MLLKNLDKNEITDFTEMCEQKECITDGKLTFVEDIKMTESKDFTTRWLAYLTQFYNCHQNEDNKREAAVDLIDSIGNMKLMTAGQWQRLDAIISEVNNTAKAASAAV